MGWKRLGDYRFEGAVMMEDDTRFRRSGRGRESDGRAFLCRFPISPKPSLFSRVDAFEGELEIHVVFGLWTSCRLAGRMHGGCHKARWVFAMPMPDPCRHFLRSAAAVEGFPAAVRTRHVTVRGGDMVIHTDVKWRSGSKGKEGGEKRERR